MQVILAADVGGTHARIGLVALHPDQAYAPATLAYQSYRCADWLGLAEILEDFLGRQVGNQNPVVRCALAVAGYVRNDELVAENLRWPVRVSELHARLRFEQLDIVNDFEALACATQFVRREDAFDVIAALGGAGPTVVIGPGTGLGSAALVPVDGHRIVVPGEAGHIALAPGNEHEIEVLRLLGRNRPYVHTGHVLSGPGLLNLYRVLAEIDGITPALEEPAAISAAALRGDDPLARETLAMFCALLGSLAGDLAVVFKASAGVYLAGGILPAIRDFLLASDFRVRFLNKGLMRPFLAAVPVRLIEHGQLGVLGAAALAEGGTRHVAPSA
ncbi:MAG: glucokinase [Rhodanobacteraceae bacterium]|nr:MAG: glucokinase [Rhodanobacteraceae bacterium]